MQKGRRGKQEQRKRKPKTLVVTMTTASHLAEDRKGWKWSGQRKKDNKEEVKEWRRIKIAAKDSKWTQGGECPCESYAALHPPHPSHWILGKTECFSVFGSLKKISQRCEQFHNLHSTRLLLQAQKRANMRTNSLFQGGNHNTNGCIDRHLSRKESGMYKNGNTQGYCECWGFMGEKSI